MLYICLASMYISSTFEYNIISYSNSIVYE